MVTSSFHLTFNQHRFAATTLSLALLLWGCSSFGGSSASDDAANSDPLEGTIAYPFVDESKSLGREPEAEKFVIKSAVGGAEYVVQIPDGARDYDVQVPLAELGSATAAQGMPGGVDKDGANTVPTDQELVQALPTLKKERPNDTAVMDSAFGTSESEGPKQAPSYTMGIARINDFYKKRQFEFALIDINNLLNFYPNSPQLLKMKGTVLLRMRNLPLAELAWIKALEISPEDKPLARALERLQKRIAQQGKAKNVTGPMPSNDIPKPIGSTPPKYEDALSQ